MDETERIRREDAFTNAATMLADVMEEREAWGDVDPEVLADIRRWVIPMLEREADEA